MKYEDAVKRATELVAGMTRGLPVNFTDRFAAVKEIADRLMTEDAQADKPALPYPYGAMDGFLDSLPNIIEQAVYTYDNNDELIRSNTSLSAHVANVVRERFPKVVRAFPTLTELTDWILDGEENTIYQGREDAVRLANRLLGKLNEQ